MWSLSWAKKNSKPAFWRLIGNFSLWFLSCQPCHLFTLGAAKAFLRLHRRRGGVVCGVFFCFYASLRLKPSEESAKSSPLLIHHFAQQWIGIASQITMITVLKNADFLLFSLFVRPYPCKKSIHDGCTHFFLLVSANDSSKRDCSEVNTVKMCDTGGDDTPLGKLLLCISRVPRRPRSAPLWHWMVPAKKKHTKIIQIFAIAHIQIYHNQSTYQHFLDLPHQHL